MCPGCGDWFGGGWGGWGGWLIGGLLMLLFWGGVIALAFFAIRAVSRSGRQGEGQEPSSRDGESALEILQKRYARGEISREEYLEMKRDLENLG
jgi:putative membrane protein